MFSLLLTENFVTRDLFDPVCRAVSEAGDFQVLDPDDTNGDDRTFRINAITDALNTVPTCN